MLTYSIIHNAEFARGDTKGFLNFAVQRAYSAKAGIMGNGFDAEGGMVAQQAQGSHQAQEVQILVQGVVDSLLLV